MKRSACGVEESLFVFPSLYARGFLTGGGYDGIPLEINAYALGPLFFLISETDRT